MNEGLRLTFDIFEQESNVDLTLKSLKSAKGYVNGKQYIGHKLPAPVSGKVGLWTKADRVVYFDDYKVIGN